MIIVFKGNFDECERGFSVQYTDCVDEHTNLFWVELREERNI